MARAGVVRAAATQAVEANVAEAMAVVGGGEPEAR